MNTTDDRRGTVEAVAVEIAADLAGSGWIRRALPGPAAATFTRGNVAGVLATAELVDASVSPSDGWPVRVGLTVGVGYEPALGLLPLVGLRPRVSLIGGGPPAGGEALEGADPGTMTFTMRGSDDRPRLRAWVLDLMRGHAARVAARFPDAAAIVAAMPDDPADRRAWMLDLMRGHVARFSDAAGHDAAMPDEVADQRLAGLGCKFGDLGAADPGVRRLVLLAAMGRHDEAHDRLDLLAGGSLGLAGRRFVRHLRRFLDAGGPPIPPVEQTLARMPSLAADQRLDPPPPPAGIRDRNRTLRQATRNVRANAAGKTVEELEHLLAAEGAAAGVTLEPWVTAHRADVLFREQQEGRTRTRLGPVIGRPGKAIRTIIETRRHRVTAPVDPDAVVGLRRPDRAAFSAEPSTRFVAVELDPDALDWLSAVYAQTPPLAGLPVPVFVWFTEVDGALVAHIDNRRVGALAPEHAQHYTGVLREAALLDEDPSIPGFLLRLPSRTAPLLRVALPATD